MTHDRAIPHRYHRPDMTTAMPATKRDNGNRTRPCTPIYRILMVEFERQRLALGLSMAQVDDLAGTNDGHYAHMLYPDTPTGRQSRWETVQDVADALFGRGFEIAIMGSEGPRPAALGLDKGASSNALQNRHWRHTRHFAELGSKGGKARAAKLSKRQLSVIGRKGGRMWKKICEAKRRGEAHRAANAKQAAGKPATSSATSGL